MKIAHLFLLLTLIGMVVLAESQGSPQDKPLVSLANDRIQLSLRTDNGAFVNIHLQDDPNQNNPLAAMGHFLCLDGFGEPSPEEKAAGMPFHGEASRRGWKVADQQATGKQRSISLTCQLPLVQEAFSRKLEIIDGENIIYVENELESLVAFDRPVSWAEHATLGPAFLEKGQVVVDMPAKQCRVRAEKPGPIPGRLIYLRDFLWPMAPTAEGHFADLRLVPENNCLDLASCQIDPAREFGFVTAIHLTKRLLFGYIFKREEYPWLMSWMNYTGDARAARGMEFSTQPFDVSRRDAVSTHSIFGTPTFRWLPAKSKIRSRFLLFFLRLPDGFTKVDEAGVAGGWLKIEDRAAGKTIAVPASLPLW
jgi:hypothetical protein